MKAIALLALALAAACWDRTATDQSRSDPGSNARAAAAPAVALRGWVTDAAEVIGPQEEASLSARLAEFERRSGRQMVVVTVPSLHGQDIAPFTTALGNSWGIGRAEQDDGIILLVAPNERRGRIAVGLGLEQTLPDALCRQILEREIMPRFRDGRIASGIDAGVAALIRHAS